MKDMMRFPLLQLQPCTVAPGNFPTARKVH